MTEKPVVGQIVKILDNQRLIANRGLMDGWAKGDHLVVYEEGEEVQDPVTGESLGKLELVKAEVEAAHVQERMTFLVPRLAPRPQEPHTVLSAVLTRTPSGTMPGSQTLRREPLPVKGSQISGMPSINPVSIGDFVRKV